MVEPAVKILRSFLDQEASSVPGKDAPNDTRTRILDRGLWTQYVCKVSNAMLNNQGTVSVVSFFRLMFHFSVLSLADSFRSGCC